MKYWITNHETYDELIEKINKQEDFSGLVEVAPEGKHWVYPKELVDDNYTLLLDCYNKLDEQTKVVFLFYNITQFERYVSVAFQDNNQRMYLRWLYKSLTG